MEKAIRMRNVRFTNLLMLLLGFAASTAVADGLPSYAMDGAGGSGGETNAEAVAQPSEAVSEQSWNWHVQNTVIVQGDPGFAAKYSGPNTKLWGIRLASVSSANFFASNNAEYRLNASQGYFL